MTMITLTIRDTTDAGGRGFLFHVRADDRVIAANRSIPPAEAEAVRRLTREYLALFEQPGRLPQAPQAELDRIGGGLFSLWFGELWSQLPAPPPGAAERLLVVESACPDILNLPWELLRPPTGPCFGLDLRLGIRRKPWIDPPLVTGDGPQRPGPLRVLFLACSPHGLPELDYEREEELLQRALAKAGPRVVLDSGDLGSFEELGERLNAFQPHVVHLTGHGAVIDGEGCFAFEDERGCEDLRSSTVMAQELFAGSGVQCALISGCQTGQAPAAALSGLCQGLVRHGVPLAIGWTASILDDVANTFAEAFYTTLAAGQSVDRALTQGRQKARHLCERRRDPSWTLPVLYAAGAQARLVDLNRPVEPAPRPALVQFPLPGITEGFARHFIGRRREQQRLLPVLRSGEVQLVLLSGLGGAGKSTLATRLARKLEQDGFRPLAIGSQQANLLSPARLIQDCATAFRAVQRSADAELLQDAKVPVDDRLRHIVSVLNETRFVLVLDNLETVLDETTRRFLDPALAAFFRQLRDYLVGGSRAILTSRYPPAELDPLPPTARCETLADFSEAAFLKFLRRQEMVEQRLATGALPLALVRRVYAAFGGAPRFLEQIRTVLAEIPDTTLEQELDALTLPAAGGGSQLWAAREAYFDSLFLGRLYGQLPAASQRALSQAAVYSLPMTLEGLAAATGQPESALTAMVADWRRLALAYPEREGRLWSIYGLLRPWLQDKDRLPPEERQHACRAGGMFLTTLVDDDREDTLDRNWIACLLEARALFLAAEALDEAQTVTERVCFAFLRQGLYAEIERLNAELLKRREHPALLGWIARSHLERANYAEARQGYQRALDVYQQIGDRAGEAVVWHELGRLDFYEGAYAAAREKFAKALASFQQIGDRAGEAATWHALASLDLNEGAYPAAREKFAKALTMRQQIGDRAGEAATLAQLGNIDLNEGAYPAAREKFGQAMTIMQQIGDRAGEASTWHNLATLDLNEGAYAAAREKFERSLAIEQQIGNRAGEARTWHQLATLDLNEGAYPAAREKFAKALAMFQQLGDRAGEAATWHQLGGLAIQTGRPQEGLRLVALCFLMDRQIGHGDTDKDLRTLAALAEPLGKTAEQVGALLEEVWAAYQADQGARLLRQAFPEQPPQPPSSS